jgi:predicted HAD superfamily phosphohydrolase
VIGDSITDSVMLSKAKRAGALAMSFNGNRYSIPNSNVALLSENCWASAAIVALHGEIGSNGLRDLLLNSEGDFSSAIQSAKLGGEPGENVRRALTSHGAGPRAYWVVGDGIDEIIAESEEFRKKVRGTSIGSLG